MQYDNNVLWVQFRYSVKFNSSVIKRPLVGNSIYRDKTRVVFIWNFDYCLTRDTTLMLTNLASFCEDDKVGI